MDGDPPPAPADGNGDGGVWSALAASVGGPPPVAVVAWRRVEEAVGEDGERELRERGGWPPHPPIGSTA